MPEIDGIIRVLQMAYRELGGAFEGLEDTNVWKRPGPNLPSVGEIAGHMAHLEAMMLAGSGPTFETDVADLPIKSWLVRNEFVYPPKTLAQPVHPSIAQRTGAEVRAELQRVHDEALAYAKGRGLGPTDVIPGWEDKPEWAVWLAYAAFHASYHTGQIYTTRHMLGEIPPDN